MSKLSSTINRIFKLYQSKGCTAEQIVSAEKELKLKFSQDYVEYLKVYGAISFLGTELTGLNVDDYVNVVSITIEERENNPNFPQDCIVIENTRLEGLLVLQSSDGKIYNWSAGKKEKIFNTLNEYIEDRANCIS